MAKLVPVRRTADELLGYAHWCPGCECAHIFYTTDLAPGPKWAFDGNMEQPTFAPSMRYFSPERKDETGKVVEPETTLCHYFLKAGEIDFLADSGDHKLRGKMPLPDFPADYRI